MLNQGNYPKDVLTAYSTNTSKCAQTAFEGRVLLLRAKAGLQVSILIKNLYRYSQCAYYNILIQIKCPLTVRDQTLWKNQFTICKDTTTQHN